MSAGQEEPLRRWLAAARAQLDEATLARTVRTLSAGQQMSLEEHWPLWLHGGQREPEGDWRVWVIMAGRGFGKTRAGAEWLWARLRETPGARVALVGATIDEAAKLMVEGPSGLIATARIDEATVWTPSKRELALPAGGLATVYSGAKPDGLRGREHHFAWCDEIAAWRHGEVTWANLMLGLRLGERPRAVVTTTPRPGTVLGEILAAEGTALTGGRTAENQHLSAEWRAAMARAWGGTRLGRQELDGELLGEAQGALWSRASIEAARGPAPAREDMRRVVIGVDPPASAAGTCGIVACGLGRDGVGHVLADHSAAGLSPNGWAAKVAAASEAWAADRIVAEANNGGRMIEAVLRGAGPALPVRLVHASDGKAARAEPVAALFESGRARLAGRFPELEDQLSGLVAGGGYAGPGRSPDRADAMVWALTELMLGPRRTQPRVRAL